MTKSLIALITAAATMLCSSCERLSIEEELDSVSDTKGCNIILHASPYTQTPFDAPRHSRATQSIDAVCTRITFAVYNSTDGTRVKVINQDKEDKSFGTAGITLPEGNYHVLALAHNSTKSASATTADKITFDGNRVTDTFYEYTDISVQNTDASETHNLTVRRAVAKFSLTITDAIPDDCKQLKFYYTGGSSTFSAITGFGCINSRQTVILDVSPDQKEYEVYTFPHEEEDYLNIKVTALDASGETISAIEMEDVPVAINKITHFSAELFDTDSYPSNANNKIQLKADPEWNDTIELIF